MSVKILQIMNFANTYLARHIKYPLQIHESAEQDLDIIVCVPCYNEPAMISCLEKLWECERPACSIEIIVNINSPEHATKDILEHNRRTLRQCREWAKKNNSRQFKLYPLYFPSLPGRRAGAGLARKIAMDHAVDRFNSINKPDGIIVSYDADAICQKNYLKEIYSLFKKYPDATGCNIYFEHQSDSNLYSPEIINAICQYELYLRYFVEALCYTGFPYAYHTIGSSFAVRAKVYTKQGGMNQRQAGEDFYFLHKIFPLGKFYTLNSTTITLSPRPSTRTPFGTGARVYKFIKYKKKYLMVYNPIAFVYIKNFINNINSLFKINQGEIDNFLNSLHPSLKNFLLDNNFKERIQEINKNTSRQETFRKRLFYWFNAFRIIKYLNFSHKLYFSKQKINQAASNLLLLKNKEFFEYDIKKLLNIYRKLQKKSV